MKSAHIPRTLWALCATALVISFFVGILALTTRTSTWLLFWLWALALALPAGWSLSAIAQEFGGAKGIAALLRTHRKEILCVLAITAFALGLRTVALSTIPYPFGTDEPFNVYNTQTILSGNQTNMFSYAILGHPALVPFLTAGLHRFFSPELAQRIPSALFGTLFVPLLYLLLRAMWGRRVALAGAAYAATYHLHVHYSRIAINNIQSATIAVLAVYCAWLALERKRPAYFILAGLSTALSWYAYVGTRLVLPIVLGMFAHGLVTRTVSLKRHAKYFTLFVLAAIIVVMPLAVRLPLHPAELIARKSMLMPLHGTDALLQIPLQIAESFAFFIVLPETLWDFYRAPIPFVDWLSLIPFLIGGISALAAFRLKRNWALLLLFLSPLVVLGGFAQSPYSGRFLLAIPAVCAWVVLGVERSVRFLKLPRNAFPVIVMLLCAANAAFYFGIYAPGDYYAGGPMRAHLQLLEHARTLPVSTEVYLYGSPRVAVTNPEIMLALRNYSVFEVRMNGTINTAGRVTRSESSPRTFLFFADLRTDELKALQAHCPGGTLFSFTDRTNVTVAYAYTFLTNSTCKPIVLARNAAAG